MFRPNNKTDSDRFETCWHQSNDRETFVLSVWEAPTFVGPGAYNSGHIDYILNDERNNVKTVIDVDEGTNICRRLLNKYRVKFTP